MEEKSDFLNGYCATVNDPNYVPRRVLTVEQAANWLAFSDSMVYKLFHDGELEGFGGPGGIRVYADSVEAFKLRHANKTKPARTRETSPRPRPARKRTLTDTQGLKYL